MVERVSVGSLSIARVLHDFVASQVLAPAGIDPAEFWAGAGRIFTDLTPKNRALLAERDRLQTEIDQWHSANRGRASDLAAYKDFLTAIGYLRAPVPEFTITTDAVDTEIALQAGPQLVVPLTNARFAVNAANSRWGSLYDALYGADVIPDDNGLARGKTYNALRGADVIARGRAFLDSYFPLVGGTHSDAVGYSIDNGELVVRLPDGSTTGLASTAQLTGYRGDPRAPESILLNHHRLHVDILIDRGNRIGQTDPAGVMDIVLEAAVTTIMDLEDSVAAVDAEDKVLAYRNWLELLNGTLDETFEKNGSPFRRTLNDDRIYRAPDGQELWLSGRSLLFIRHVGHHMFTDVILDADSRPVPEGILDALITTASAIPNLQGRTRWTNSRTGSLYIVKPKMHGPEEVAFTVELFDRVEKLLGLDARTLKVGIMDEERRTSVNLLASIYAARDRVVFINTGFLDRTGDEIHTSMAAGPFARKAALKNAGFLAAYEVANVDAGLAAGFVDHAQIGKGMWAMPDLMRDMLSEKVGQLKAGASAAWVPSPTAATLHALHYHEVDVAAVQRDLRTRTATGIDPILRIPLADPSEWSVDDVRNEVDNNVQSILGYVVRWVDQGIGCSKVSDINNVNLMEDRATLRISSQLLANWLTHAVITEEDVTQSLRRIAPIVDRQNAGDPDYHALSTASGDTSTAFLAARDLILLGAAQPNGYTEPILHAARRLVKSNSSTSLTAS